MVREPRSAAKAPAFTNRGERPLESRLAPRVQNAYSSKMDDIHCVSNTCKSLDEGLTTKRAGQVELEACLVGHSSTRTHGENCTWHKGSPSVVDVLQLGIGSCRPVHCTLQVCTCTVPSSRTNTVHTIRSIRQEHIARPASRQDIRYRMGMGMGATATVVRDRSIDRSSHLLRSRQNSPKMLNCL